MEIIKLIKICKKYLKDDVIIEVLNNISISFSEGFIYAIKGESGAGKTTLLKTIAMLSPIDEGTILINNRNVYELSDFEISTMRNKNIGIIFQNYKLFSHLTTIENVIIPLLTNDNIDMQKKKQMCEEKLAYVGLKKRDSHYSTELSGGEQQRVAIARALINDPKIILADEPTGNLDKANKIKILSIFKSIAKDGKCVIIVTHDDDVLKIADFVYNIKDGKLLKYENKK